MSEEPAKSRALKDSSQDKFQELGSLINDKSRAAFAYQWTSAATETRSWSHPNTVAAESERVIYPRQMKRLNEQTAT